MATSSIMDDDRLGEGRGSGRQGCLPSVRCSEGTVTVRCSAASLTSFLVVLIVGLVVFAGSGAEKTALAEASSAAAADSKENGEDAFGRARGWAKAEETRGVVPAAVELAVAAPSAREASGSVEVVNVPCPSMPKRKTVPATVVLPASYNRPSGDGGSNRTAYPVLYILHGATNKHDKWIRVVPSLLGYATSLDIILVFPDGGSTSWYFDSPIDPKYQYETFVAEELIRYVDAKYRTKPAREGRAVMGNSMGGHGALFLSLRHPELFDAAVSMSGGLDIRPRPFPERWDIKERLGPIENNTALWDNSTVMAISGKMLRDGTFPKNLGISMDVGVGDFFLKVNRDFHRLLVDHKVDHDYIEMPGGHGWGYWKRSVRHEMEFLDERLNGKNDEKKRS